MKKRIKFLLNRAKALSTIVIRKLKLAATIAIICAMVLVGAGFSLRLYAGNGIWIAPVRLRRR